MNKGFACALILFKVSIFFQRCLFSKIIDSSYFSTLSWSLKVLKSTKNYLDETREFGIRCF